MNSGIPPSQAGPGRWKTDGWICREGGPQKCAQVRRSSLRLRSSQAELSCWELGALAPTHPSWSGPAEEGSPLVSIHLASLTPSPPCLDLLPSFFPVVLRLSPSSPPVLSLWCECCRRTPRTCHLNASLCRCHLSFSAEVPESPAPSFYHT